MDHEVTRRRAGDRTTTWRTVLIGLATMAGLVGLFTVMPASAEHVTPIEMPGNVACPAGLTELKVEPVADGTFTDGTLTVTIDVFNTADGQEFNWTSNIGVDRVIVKGGNASNIYIYDPEATADTGLHAPANRSGSWAGLSHVSFCYDFPDETTTTAPTTVPTTPTTAPSTTTTAPSTTTTVPPTTTSVPSSSTSTPPTST
jgi:hypothetical protein